VEFSAAFLKKKYIRPETQNAHHFGDGKCRPRDDPFGVKGNEARLGISIAMCLLGERDHVFTDPRKLRGCPSQP
jgi:hypothetical protein